MASLICCAQLLSLLLILSTTAATARNANLTCFPSDLSALRSFAASFPAGNFSDWEASDDCCAWRASVTCSLIHSTTHAGAPSVARVTGLSLDTNVRHMNNYPIPESSLCSLSALTSLDLSGYLGISSIISDFPSGIDVYYDRPSGLRGSIPDCIGNNLTKLVELDLSFNTLTGYIPHSFSRLPSLRWLYLEGNSLQGPLPSFLSSGLLTQLDLSFNAFSGPIPAFHTPYLFSLDLEGNSFSGSLSRFGSDSSLLSLSFLRLSSNFLSGNLPTNFLNNSSLYVLDLSSNALSGQLLASSLNQQLASLDLSNNQFMGPFPEWIGSLSNLVILSLSHNNFKGSLPSSWRNLSVLHKLDLSDNSLVLENRPLTGARPPFCWLFQFPFMELLSLSSMHLQATDLKICCSQLLHLLNGTHTLALELSNNNLTSDVLPCLSRPSERYSLLVVNVSRNPLGSVDLTDRYAFQVLNLSGNPLALDLNNPDAVKLLPQAMSQLDLSRCGLRGRLTGLFFDRVTPSISSLYLAHNHLTGVIPAQLGNLSSLYSLDLSYNFFTGFSPLVHKLHWPNLLLSNNHLAGNLSSMLLDVLNISVCSSKEVQSSVFNKDLDLSYNLLGGQIPSYLGDCIAKIVRKVKLNDNLLEGIIPDGLFNNHDSFNLQVLSLSNNHLSGHIPASFRNLKQLVLLDLGHNRLEGSLESSALFSNTSHQYVDLRVLLLGSNEFSGSVPVSLGEIAPSLQLIDFSNNHLTGPIPVHTLQALPAFRAVNKGSIPGLSIVRGTLFEELRITVKDTTEEYQYVLEALTALDLSGNNLSGPISTGLGELSGLVSLNLSRNRLSGPIPSDIGNLSRQLQSLDLSFNALVGSIPPTFAGLTNLEVFNVSYNKGLSGPIPNQPQFERADSYVGDPNLCGAPILHSCAPVHDKTLSAPPMNTVSPAAGQSNKFASWIDEWIAIPGLCLGIVVGFAGTLLARALLARYKSSNL